jgi:hypothetical protein
LKEKCSETFTSNEGEIELTAAIVAEIQKAQLAVTVVTGLREKGVDPEKAESEVR